MFSPFQNNSTMYYNYYADWQHINSHRNTWCALIL